MFTGIIEEIGVLTALHKASRSARMTVRAVRIPEDMRTGDSISVNGVCLTVNHFDAHGFTADVMPETLTRTNLGLLKPGQRVNLERAVQLGGRLGGHLVSGHIDGTGRIESRFRDGNAEWFRITAGPGIMKFIAAKGSVAVDGISLTVVDVSRTTFTVSVIPHTQSETILNEKTNGDLVNIECDMVARYLEKLTGSGESSGRISEGFLAENGFTE